MQRKKIDLAKVMAALNTPCPEGVATTFRQTKSHVLDSARMKCPKCGQVFEAKRPINRNENVRPASG